jgi:hypothetical protein
VAQLVEALRYKPAGRGFDGALAFFHCHNPVGQPQPLTETSTRNISWGINAAGTYD